ncbi:MAG TPA: HD-GYP domain-containing protein [Gemmatimonadaceae bacterium]|nr:HD-GYP domain-containing protein [Gemmatimonadaceae bacterium]
MSFRVRLFIAAVAVAAAIATLQIGHLAPGPVAQYLPAVMFLTAVGAVGQILVYQLPHGATGSVSFIPFLAGALVAPHWLAVIGAALAELGGEVYKKREVPKAIFNMAQTALSTAIAILVFLSLGGISLDVLSGGSVTAATSRVGTAFAGAVLTYFVVNSAAVSAVIALNEKQRFWKILHQNTPSSLVYIVLSYPVVFFLAWVYVRSGPIAAALMLFPIFGARQLFAANVQLDRVNHELLQLMVKAIEARDPYTSGHSRRVAQYSEVIARAVGLSARHVKRIATAALLHDVGKIHEIYAPILRKPDRLTPDEWEIIKTHPIKSAELVSNVSHLRDLIPALRHHHENWDGTGYPDGIAGDAIPLAARIIIFADTIDAMTSDRPYRKALGEAEVRAELLRCRGKQFDPVFCDRLLASPLFATLFELHRANPVRADEASAPVRQPRLRIASL